MAGEAADWVVVGYLPDALSVQEAGLLPGGPEEGGFEWESNSGALVQHAIEWAKSQDPPDWKLGTVPALAQGVIAGVLAGRLAQRNADAMVREHAEMTGQREARARMARRAGLGSMGGLSERLAEHALALGHVRRTMPL